MTHMTNTNQFSFQLALPATKDDAELVTRYTTYLIAIDASRRLEGCDGGRGVSLVREQLQAELTCARACARGNAQMSRKDVAQPFALNESNGCVQCIENWNGRRVVGN